MKRNSFYRLWRKLTFYFLFYTLLTNINFNKELSHYSHHLWNKYIDISYTPLAHKHLSFIYLDLLEERIDKSISSTKISSQEIIINGIHNVSLKSKLMDFLAVHINNNTIFKIETIQNWITKMKFSGFFCHVDYIVQSIGQHQVIHINVKVNPILQKIYIYNYKNKIIPYSYILTEFHQQLGAPINFNHINQSVSRIVEWYHKRGYNLAKVQLVSHNKYDKSIKLNIIEGTIKRVEIHIHRSTKNAAIDNFSVKIPLIFRILNLQINTPFNMYVLEHGLQVLQKKNMISYANYKIHGESNISVLIYLKPVNHDIRFFYSQKNLISDKMIRALKLLTHVSFTQIQKTVFFIQSHNYCLTQKKLQNIIFDDSLYLSENSINKTICNNIFLQKVYNELKLHTFFCHSLDYQQLDDLSIQYNIDTKNMIVLFNSRLSGLGKDFRLNIVNWVIDMFRDIKNCITCEIYQKNQFNTCTNNFFLPNKKLILQKGLNFFRLSESFIAIKVYKQFSMNISFTRELSMKNLSYKYCHLYNLSNWDNMYLPLAIVNHKLIFPKIQNLWNENIEYFTKLEWQFDFDNYFRQYNSIKFLIKSVCILPFNYSEISNIYLAKYNYNSQIILGIEQNFYIYNKNINVLFLGMKMLGESIHLPALEQNIYVGFNLIRGYSEKLCLLPKQFGKISVDYSLFSTSKNSLFLFVDYACGLNFFKSKYFSFRDILFYPLDNTLVSEAQISYGIGFHFQAPIRQFPPLRFEYGYNINRISFFHIRIKKNKL